ncbi:MAG: orotidine-5'-phosphate decarboxylase [Clostridiales Family XIII bacterium]|nr:orotidine-5'-phosphate decarboxylase [Clostridiales Family XIII bacterium]
MIDTLIARIDELKNPTVVGLDPTVEMIPQQVQTDYFEQYGKTPFAVADMFFHFNKAIIDAIYDIVPAVKPQIAMYEQYGIEGLSAYVRTTEYAKSKGLIVIGDIKRGDIGSTSAAYAAHIDGVKVGDDEFDLWHEDFVTLAPYMGSDGIKPFTSVVESKDKGLFILLKTSNPSSSEIQDVLVASDSQPLYLHVGKLIEDWGKDSIGAYGYSKVGAVVGATQSEEGRLVRSLFPHMFFLVPGYGAQGAGAADLKGFFDKDGRGCIVNSSRGIIAAYQKHDEYKNGGLDAVGDAARQAALDMRAELRTIL